MPVVAGRLVVSSDDGSQVESTALQAQSVIWGAKLGNHEEEASAKETELNGKGRQWKKILIERRTATKWTN